MKVPTHKALLFGVVKALAQPGYSQSKPGDYSSQPVPFTAVKMSDNF